MGQTIISYSTHYIYRGRRKKELILLAEITQMQAEKNADLFHECSY